MGEFKYSKLNRPEMIRQIKWRKDNISTQEFGIHSFDKITGEPKKYPHIVPFENWLETIWLGVREKVDTYINTPGKEIHAHDGTNNLLSSWVQCVNLYFGVKTDPAFKVLMTEFLKEKVSSQIVSIDDVELEFAFPNDDALHPNPLLGETTGSRGKKQTSPDVAFLVKNQSGKDGIIFTENKYTEYHFYPCSTDPATAKYKSRNLNLDFSRCMKPAKGYDYKTICHQQNAWHRKYMDWIEFSVEAESILNCCPAATDGYQLFRQQALAEGIAQSNRFELVANTVAYDERNDDLIGCLKTTGIDEFSESWGKLFNGKAIFKTWTHQDWVQFVRDNQKNGEFDDWLEYVGERYGYCIKLQSM